MRFPTVGLVAGSYAGLLQDYCIVLWGLHAWLAPRCGTDEKGQRGEPCCPEVGGELRVVRTRPCGSWRMAWLREGVCLLGACRRSKALGRSFGALYPRMVWLPCHASRFCRRRYASSNVLYLKPQTLRHSRVTVIAVRSWVHHIVDSGCSPTGSRLRTLSEDRIVKV